MYLSAMITECDATGAKYDEPVEGCYAMIRGNSGRVGAVLAIGPEYMEKYGIVVSTYEQVEEWAESEPGGYLDF